MRILDRYILKSVFAIFLSCVFLFLFLYIIINIISKLEDILKLKLTLQFLTQYYLYHIPIIFVQVSPFACLLATLYTYGRLNHTNEIIAMRSSGLSIFQISKTVLIMGGIISLCVFWVNDRFVPQALSQTQKMWQQVEQAAKIRKEQQETIIDNLTMYGLRNRLFFVNKFHVSTGQMDGIIILEQDEHQNITKKIVANKGIYKDNFWRFSQSITYNFDVNGQILQEPQYYEEEIMAIPETPSDFVNQRQRPDYMNIAQLDDYIWKFSKSGATSVIRGLKVDLYQRFTSPFTSMIIILLGIPFAMMMRKRAAGLVSIGVSILAGVLYFILEAVCIALGKGAILSPALAAASSHLIAIAFSVYLIYSLP